MSVAEKYATCEDKLAAEIAMLKAILARRGQWYEDEQVAHDSYANVVCWMADDKAERDRIELAAMEAEEEQKRNDPNFKTRELFKGVRINIPKKEMVR